ncbi:ribosome assembly RNA-binding protein YhbY, partial [Shewanella sp. 11B5]
ADRELKNAIVDAIVRETQSTKVQLIGHVLVIFRHSAEMKIALPKAK